MLSSITAEKVSRKAKQFAEEMVRKLEKFNEECKARMTNEEREALERFNKEYPCFTRQQLIQELEECFVDYLFSRGIAGFLQDLSE